MFSEYTNYDDYLENMTNYLSYCYGDSYFKDKNNLINIINFYLYFPIYFKKYEKLKWNQILIILDLENEKREFYINKFLLNNFDSKYFDLFLKIDMYDLMH